MAVTKRAVVVGCNYPSTANALRGCVNDAMNWRSLLIETLGFEAGNITLLLDSAPATTNIQLGSPPTGANIKYELRKLVQNSKAGDVACFAFSGHGTRDNEGPRGDNEADGYDEAIVPTDLNLIFDDDLRDILSGLDPGVKFTMVSDCCHSGGLLDHEEVVISGGAGTYSNSSYTQAVASPLLYHELVNGAQQTRQASKDSKNRTLNIQNVGKMLKQIAPQHAASVDEKGVRAALYDIYGKDASNVALAEKKEDLPTERAQQIRYVARGTKPLDGLNDPNKGILITGCQSSGYSQERRVAGGPHCGLFTLVITSLVRWNQKKPQSVPLTNYDLVCEARAALHGYFPDVDQNPCLECSLDNANTNFIVW